MALAASSSDVVGCITTYLDAIAITRLVECGSRLLSAKIMQSCKNLELRSWPFMKFPFSLFNFPKLTSLSLLRHQMIREYPLLLNGAIPLPTMPVNSLGKLNLHFAQCFSVLRLENDIPILDILFPNLKSLKLGGSTVPLSSYHMKALPTKVLEELLLRSRYEVSEPSLPISALLNLPSTLQSLHIDPARILVDEKTNDYSRIVWPSHLTKLTLSPIGLCIINHLPSTLEYLDLGVLPNEGKLVPSPIPTSVLPKKLLSARVSILSHIDIHFVPTTFPVALKRCDLPFDFSIASKASDWALLPKSLTHISDDYKLSRVIPLIPLLPNLRSFPTVEDPTRSIPQNLVEMRLEGVDLASLPLLPPTIRTLAVKISPLSSASQPLSTNTPAVQRTSNSGSMSCLPPYLEYLKLINADPDSKFCDADFALIPPTLNRLSLDLHDIKDRETFSVLPISLKDLSINIKPEAEKNLYSDSLLLDTLPTGITTLMIYIRPVETAWYQWMLNLHRFSALSELHIYLDHPVDDTEPISLGFLSSLPNSITELSLPLHLTKIMPEHIKCLPKKLASLTLELVDEVESTSSATDECFIDLPKTMVSLRLPDGLEGLTPKLLSILPTSLCHLFLPDAFNSIKKYFYKRQPEWGGYQPC